LSRSRDRIDSARSSAGFIAYHSNPLQYHDGDFRYSAEVASELVHSDTFSISDDSDIEEEPPATPIQYILDSGEQYTIPVGDHPTSLQFDGSQNISLRPLKEEIKIITKKCETHLNNLFSGSEKLLSDLTRVYLWDSSNRKTILKNPARVSISIPDLDAYSTTFVAVVKEKEVNIFRGRIIREKRCVDFQIDEDCVHFIWGSKESASDLVIAQKEGQWYFAIYNSKGFAEMSSSELLEIKNLRERSSINGRIIENIVLPEQFAIHLYSENGETLATDSINLASGFVIRKIPIPGKNIPFLHNFRIYRSQSFGNVFKEADFHTNTMNIPLTDICFLHNSSSNYKARFSGTCTRKCQNPFKFRLRRGSKPWGCLISHSNECRKVASGHDGLVLLGVYGSDIDITRGELKAVQLTDNLTRWFCTDCSQTVYLKFNNDESYYFLSSAIEDRERKDGYSFPELVRMETSNEDILVAHIFTKNLPPTYCLQPRLRKLFPDHISVANQPTQLFKEQIRIVEMSPMSVETPGNRSASPQEFRDRTGSMVRTEFGQEIRMVTVDDLHEKHYCSLNLNNCVIC